MKMKILTTKKPIRGYQITKDIMDKYRREEPNIPYPFEELLDYDISRDRLHIGETDEPLNQGDWIVEMCNGDLFAMTEDHVQEYYDIYDINL